MESQLFLAGLGRAISHLFHPVPLKLHDGLLVWCFQVGILQLAKSTSSILLSIFPSLSNFFGMNQSLLQLLNFLLILLSSESTSIIFTFPLHYHQSVVKLFVGLC